MKKCGMCDEEFDEDDARQTFLDYLWSKGLEGEKLSSEFDNWYDEDLCGWCNAGQYTDSACY